VPVLGGIVVLAAIFAVTYGIASWIAHRDEATTPRLAPRTLPLGGVGSVAETIDESGPILFPDLDTRTGTRSLILDHRGDDPTRGWSVYLAYPAGAEATCTVTQVRNTSRFVDCTGAEVDVDALARPSDACPIVENRTRLSLGLVADLCG
jgi:hypothetical protein